MKYIYKITNKTNGKVYIGQTKDLNKRWNEHIGGNTGSAINLAIKKYGMDNFSFEELEYVENYNEREKELILLYGSYGGGYNLTPGGEDGAYQRYELETIEDIKELLRKGVELEKIKSEFGCSISFLVNLNYGRVYEEKQETYPLSPNSKNFPSREEVQLIEGYLIVNQNVSLKDVAIYFKRGKTTIESINSGRHRFSSKLDFPLKKSNSKLSKQEVENIENLLSNTNKTIKEIILETNRSEDSIIAINYGRHSLSNKQRIFPIR